MATATVSYRAELSDLRTKLASVTDITRAEARKMVTELNRSMRAVEKAQTRAAASAKNHAAAARGTATAMSSLAQAGAAAVVAAGSFAAMVQDVADARNALTDLSSRSGVARETLAGLKLAAEGSGLAFSDVEGIVTKLPKIMGDAARGSKAQADAFKMLGVEVTDASGAMRDGDTVFRELVAALGEIESPTERAAAAAQLFGKSGTKLLQALGNPSALDAFVGLAGQSAINSADAAEKAAAWQRSVAELGLVMDGVKASIIDALDITERVDDFALGLTFMGAAVQELGVQVADFGKLGASVFTSLADGEFMAAGRAADEFATKLISPVEKLEALRAAVNKGTEAAQGFHEMRAAVREASGAIGDYSDAAGVGFSRTKALEEAQRAAAQAAREAAQAVKQLAAIEQAASLQSLEGRDRIVEQYRRQMAAIDELEAASQNHEAAERARIATRAAMTADLAKQQQADDKRLADAMVQHQREIARAEQQRIREREQAETAMYSAINSLASTSASALLGYANQVAESNKEAAMDAFNAYKAVAITQAAVSAAAGAVRALADYPYPYSLIVAGLVAAQGAIQVGMIAAQQPSFADTPGIQRAGYQGMTASFAPGDMVIAGRDEGDLVRQMQRAGLGGGGGTQVLVRDTDRHHGRYGRDPMRAPERYTPLRRRAGRTPGRR